MAKIGRISVTRIETSRPMNQSTIVAARNGGSICMTSICITMTGALVLKRRPERRTSHFRHLRHKEQLYAVQHLTHGRVLRLAPRLQNPVWRPYDSSGVPAGGGRSDQRRRLSRALADTRAQGSRRARFAEAARQGD